MLRETETIAGFLQVILDTRWLEMKKVKFTAYRKDYPQDLPTYHAVAIDNLCLRVTAALLSAPSLPGNPPFGSKSAKHG